MPAQPLEWGNLTVPPRLAALGVIAAGSAALLWNLTQWHAADFGLFLGYLTVATAAAALRIRLPGLQGALSLHFFFVLICIPQLTVAETMLVACAGALLQCMVFMKPLRGFAVVFDLAVAALSANAAFWAYSSSALGAAAGRSPLRLVVAASVLFLTTTAPPAIIAALGQHRSLLKTWRENFFWTFPHYIAGGGAAGLLSLMGNRTGWEAALLIVPVIYWMFHSYRYYVDQLQEERRQVRELGSLHFRTIEALALAIEGHDPAKHGHLRRVSIYVTEIGRHMRLPEPELQALHAAAMLHDIGKLAVPEHIVTKPGKLSEEEFERIKIHPVAGAEILEQVQFPYPVAPVVRAHHEKWDGTGYPAGLKGPEIPVGARILAAVDCFDALVSDRYHRRALTLDQAMEYLRAESGRSFDPEVISILGMRYRSLEDKVRAARQQEQVRGGSVVPNQVGAPFLTRIAAARQEEQQFFELARDLGNSLSLEKTFAACAKRLQAMCPYDSLVIFLRRDRTLVPEYASGAYLESLSSFPVHWGSGVAGLVADQRSAVVNMDPAAELSGCTPPVLDLVSALAVPIEGVTELLGVITLYSRTRDRFSADDLRIVSGVALRASGAIENALRYTQAEQSATTDVLTGLPNPRSLFLHLDGELARARRNRDSVTVLVCDLDRFKQLNDLYGHMEGNRALRAVAQALKKQCREYDFVARLGGDEFVVVLPTHRAESAKAKIEQLRQAVTASVADIAAGVGISIGYACYPEDGEDAEALLASADRRMYSMKQQSVAQSAESTALELQRLSATLGPRSTIQ
jgi:diguanylate cyclase (GGDEF)-like protein/putative nucleotidyltransferase with HDIG domain